MSDVLGDRLLTVHVLSRFGRCHRRGGMPVGTSRNQARIDIAAVQYFAEVAICFAFLVAIVLVDDVLYIGSNIVTLFSIPSFMELFFTTQMRTQMKYFKQQFDEHIFRGKNLFEYFFFFCRGLSTVDKGCLNII